MTPPSPPTIAIACHEDRDDAKVGLALLVASLQRCSGSADIVVSGTPCSDLPHDEHASARVLQFQGPDLRGRSWNVKPTMLLDLLDRGYERVAWIDADVMVTGDVAAFFNAVPADHIVVAEEYPWAWQAAGATRTRRWGLAVGRSLHVTTNSCVVAVTRDHRPLLQIWEQMLGAPAYVAAQAQLVYDRPVHMVGDQDVLMALLGSDTYGGIPLRFLQNGRDIIQHFGPSSFRVRDRLNASGGRLALFVHAQAGQPWRFAYPIRPWSLRAYYDRVNAELSPYTWLARRHAEMIEGVSSHDWLTPRTIPAKLMQAVTRNDPALQGLVLASLEASIRRIKRLLGISPWREGRTQAPPAAEQLVKGAEA
ncbi:MAG: hypothetical protein WD009_01635 [Phycisphaeraceae bacterium]